VAKNAVVVPTSVIGPDGEIEIDFKDFCGGGGGGFVPLTAELLPPPQAVMNTDAARINARNTGEVLANRIDPTPRFRL
jgi:hypothetical protein